MLLDTSGLLCLQHAGEPLHKDAVTFFDAAGVKVTHNYVIAEYVALATARRFPRREMLHFVQALDRSTEVRVAFVDPYLHHRALELLQARDDKGWSLCDAVSFVLMSDLGMIDALTTDRHFEQAGFRRLLTP
jgi:predicted nucleic acid-binding protein